MIQRTGVSVALPLLFAAGLLVPPSGEVSAQAGAIEGVVKLQAPPRPRRSADRYPGRASATRQIQQIPAVAYLLGPVEGTPPGSGSRRLTMMQRDTAFVPPAVVVQPGTTVAFPNQDPFFHNVFSYSSARRFDLGRYPQGESKLVTFDEPGIVNVFCEVHDFMRGAIVVTENPFHAVAAEDGTFRIEGVPAGEHTLAVWHPDHETTERTVRVTSGGTTTVEVELRR